MKSFNDLADKFEKMAQNIDKKMIEANEKTAQQVWEDVIENAPMGTGAYIESIQIYPTEIKDNKITTFIGSNLTVGPTKWTGGAEYNLGYLLENGTFEHAIPNAFGKGFYYGYIDANGRFHKGTLDKDWHPGSVAIPHYSIALIKNKKLFKDNIKLAWRDK